MSQVLLTPAEVGEILNIGEPLVKRLCREQKWPHIRFSSKTIRFRGEHVEQIIAMQERAGDIGYIGDADFVLSPGSRGRAS